MTSAVEPAGDVAARLLGTPATAGLLDRVAAGDVVLVGGLARSGKSTLAAEVASRLAARGLAACTLSMDRWIVPAAERRGGGVEQRYDTGLMARTLAPWLVDGRSLLVRLPVYERDTRTRGEEPLPFDLPADAVLVLEGVLALLPGVGVGRRRAHRVYVRADEAARRQRVIDDLVARGIAAPDRARLIYEERERDESPVVRATQSTAEVVVCSDA